MSDKLLGFFAQIGLYSTMIYNMISYILISCFFGYDKNHIQYLKDSNLAMACEYDLVFFVNFYLIVGANLRSEKIVHEPLKRVFVYESFKVLKFLKDNNYKLSKDEAKYALECFILINNIKGIEFLLEEMKVCVECIDSSTINNIFHLKQYEVIKVLLRYGVNPKLINVKLPEDKKILKQIINEIEQEWVYK